MLLRISYGTSNQQFSRSISRSDLETTVIKAKAATLGRTGEEIMSEPIILAYDHYRLGVLYSIIKISLFFPLIFIG
jgi:hypothetical protein